VLEEEQALEGGGAGERAGYRCGYAELDKQGDPDEVGGLCVHGTTLRVWGSWLREG
jgi:hypothetical protein